MKSPYSLLVWNPWPWSASSAGCWRSIRQEGGVAFADARFGAPPGPNPLRSSSYIRTVAEDSQEDPKKLQQFHPEHLHCHLTSFLCIKLQVSPCLPAYFVENNLMFANISWNHPKSCEVLAMYPDAPQHFFHSSATLMMPLVDDSDNTVRQEAVLWQRSVDVGLYCLWYLWSFERCMERVWIQLKRSCISLFVLVCVCVCLRVSRERQQGCFRSP